MSQYSKKDEKWMRRALELALRGKGRVSPNPLVGAVLVRDGEVVGEGFYQRYGGTHAEANALAEAGEQAAGATLYVNLEPCCHTGKNPPCTAAIQAAGVRRVVYSVDDPNPLVGGKGGECLRTAGVEAGEGLLADEAREVNRFYLKHALEGIPFVTLKIAQTLDGMIATRTGDSRWISSVESRKLVHEMRSEQDATIVGVGTVIADNPQLTVRLVKGRNPVRIILDSLARTPVRSRILSAETKGKTVIATTEDADETRVKKLEKAGAEIWVLGRDTEGHVNLVDLLKRMGKSNITSVLLEGGTRLNTAALLAGLVDRLILFLAPRLLGNGGSYQAFGNLGISVMDEAVKFNLIRHYWVGEDIVLEGKPLCSPEL
jgi:diaminohydroxyphosphoribosylaminopyrimidine deaminase/5-amino-6-(5-phosphoribosylamino)uracil reductase